MTLNNQPMEKSKFTSFNNIDRFQYFFIRGFMRSGTNWVNNLLNLHPKVSCTGEFYFNEILDAINEKLNSPYSLLGEKNVSATARQYFEYFVKACIKEANCRSGKEQIVWYGDRTPRPLDPVVLDGAHHFLCVRDPRDVLTSWTYHLLRIPMANGETDPHQMVFDNYPGLRKKREIFLNNNEYFKENPAELFRDEEAWVVSLANDWAWRIGKNLGTIRKIEKGQINATVYLVRYETLLQDFENEKNRLFQFLGVDPGEAKPVDELTTPSFEKEDLGSHYRKGIKGDWQNYFTEDTCEFFKKAAGQALVDMGYEKDMSWSNRL
jgi:hypothetical protein